MKRRSSWICAVVILTVLAVGSFAAQQRGSAGLKSLELSTDLSPVLQLDPAFSQTLHNYSATVNSTNVKSVRINPTPVSNRDAVTVNGNPVKILTADKDSRNKLPFRSQILPSGGSIGF